MNRETKYRFWCTHDKAWLDPSLCYVRGDDGMVMEYVPGAHFNPSEHECAIPIQYTGLKDKNGVEIYEGDIVLIENADTNESGQFVSLPSKVFYDAGCFNVFPDYDEELLLSVADKCSVIGNVYENPELLEKTAA